MESIEYANGNYAWYWYDEQNRLAKLTNFAEFEQDPNNPTGDILISYEYTLAADGKRLQAVEVQDGTSRTVQWQYDNLSRLTQESVVDGYTDVYELDLVGNRLSITKDGTPTYYFYDECDLLEKECSDSAGNNVLVEYAYDDNGSLTSKDVTGGDTTTYVYNLRGRLESVTAGSNPTVSYHYDPDGNRVQKTISGGDEIDYLIDPYNHTGYEQVLSQAVCDGVNPDEVTFFIIGSDVIGQVTDTDDPLYLLYDGHGSVRQDSDTDGVAQSSYNYDAFGEADGFNPVDGLYYAGEMYDAAIDKYNNRARYYDPPTGRFITSDPYPGDTQDPLSRHRYLYCYGNPVNNVDPTGLFFSNLIYGRRVHDKIGWDFRERGIDPFYDRSVKEVLGLTTGFSIWGLDRPDLVERATGEVYEIKPAGSYIMGAGQLGWYLYLLNTNDPLKRPWIPGFSYIPPSLIKLDPITFATVSPPVAGIIIYEVIDLKPAVALVVAYETYVIMSEISTQIQLKLATPGLAWF